MILRINSANITRSLVGIFEVYSSSLLFNVKIPSLCGMLGYRPTTSAFTRKEPSGTISYSFHLMSLEYMTYRFALKTSNENQNILMLSCWSSTVGDHRFSRYIMKLLILGNRYNLPRLVAFLKSWEKYLSSFSVTNLCV